MIKLRKRWLIFVRAWVILRAWIKSLTALVIKQIKRRPITVFLLILWIIIAAFTSYFNSQRLAFEQATQGSFFLPEFRTELEWYTLLTYISGFALLFESIITLVSVVTYQPRETKVNQEV